MAIWDEETELIKLTIESKRCADLLKQSCGESKIQVVSISYGFNV